MRYVRLLWFTLWHPKIASHLRAIAKQASKETSSKIKFSDVRFGKNKDEDEYGWKIFPGEK